MRWVLFATLSAVFYLLHDYLLKSVSEKLNPFVSSLLLSLASLLILGGVLGGQLVLGTRFQRLVWADVRAIGAAGLFLALASVCFLKTFEKSAPFSIAIPYIYVVMIGLGVVFGRVFLKEHVSALQLLGIVLSCVGLFLVVKK